MIRLICGRIGRFLASIFAVLQRAICGKNRDNIGELPFHVKSAAAAASRQSADRVPLMSSGSDEDGVFDAHCMAAAPIAYIPAAGDSWGEPNWDQQVIVESKIEEFRRKKAEKTPPPVEDQVDFFSDMTPTLTKPKVLRPVAVRPQQQRNLFDFSEAAVLPQETELGVLDDDDAQGGGAWGDADVDVLDEIRQQRRDERLAEHARRNEERRAARLGSS